jgi:DNA primase
MTVNTSHLQCLLDRVLNQTSRLRKGHEAVYYCVFCHHHKRKLEINLETQNWQCWVCHTAGQSIRSLFKRLRVNSAHFSELTKIVGEFQFRPRASDEEKQQILSLPNEFISLRNSSKSMEYGNAVSYLRSRGVTKCDILRYNIGYCEQGEYKKRVVIPSYDRDGNLNFFSARAYYDSPMKYKLPPWSKDIVGFELFINWNEPITLVESQFNAITIRNNSIPLFGKTMSNKLKESLVKYGVSRVNVCLDKDAEKDAINMCDYLLNLGIDDVYFVELTKKDPNEIGFLGMVNLINNAKKIDFQSIIRKKLMLK